MLANTRRVSAYVVYLILAFVYGLAFTTIVTVSSLYQLEVARLNPLQLVLVGTALETVCFICQVPTGVLADLYSRRLSLIVGVLLVGVAFIWEGLFPNFAAILIAMILYGIGATFMSGAEEAWITDELGEANIGHTFVRGTQLSQIGGILGAVLSVSLASLRLSIPIIVGGGMIVLLGILLLLIMPERGFQRAPKEAGESQSWRGLSDIFLSGLRTAWRSPMLLLILGVGLFYGLSSEGFDRLWTPHMQLDFHLPALGPFQPVVWFGIISIVGDLLVLGVSEGVRRRFDINHQRTVIRLLIALNILGVLGLLVFAFTSNFLLAIVTVWSIGVFRGVQYPLSTTWLTQNTTARTRATLISFNGQMDALGQIAGGPPVGYLGTIFSLRVALAAVSAILAPPLLLYTIALRKMRGGPSTAVADEDEPVSIP
jgi:MFS transporter, DHA3 family, tetracycline resistance protein